MAVPAKPPPPIPDDLRELLACLEGSLAARIWKPEMHDAMMDTYQ